MTSSLWLLDDKKLFEYRNLQFTFVHFSLFLCSIKLWSSCADVHILHAICNGTRDEKIPLVEKIYDNHSVGKIIFIVNLVKIIKITALLQTWLGRSFRRVEVDTKK